MKTHDTCSLPVLPLAPDEDHFTSQHAKMGLSLFVLFWLQPLNGFLRPHPPKAGAEATAGRKIWELLHRNFGRFLLIWGAFIVLTGAAPLRPALAARGPRLGLSVA